MNQAAHTVKSDVCKIGGTAEDKAHMGAGRHGGTKSTKHAYSGSKGLDQASRTGGDTSTSMSMGSDGDMGMSRDMGMNKRQERQAACILAASARDY